MSTVQDKASTPARLGNLPISFFAIVMGLAGLTLAWEKAEQATIMPFMASPYHAMITAVVFIVLLIAYTAKYVLHREGVLKELHHPVQLSFFPTISISLLLMAVVTFEYYPELSKNLWMVGAAAHLGLTMYVLSSWINHTHFDINHMNPAWFIPVVGNIVAPIGGMQHGFVDISWFFFSVGLVFWLVLFVIVMYRIIFHNPLPDKLLPTFFILVAPPAVGFISYVKLTGGVDAFSTVLFHTALFLTLLLATQFVKFARLKFFLSWWAYSFPLAAMTIASFLMAEATGKDFYHFLAIVLFFILNMVLALLTVRTIEAMMKNQICVVED
ncbi:SLAC1 anion channel family protein [Magnetovibrio blakemorei]|uniref:C4-dicarboxylate ABC transporter n=1 Tax=Magnetovibrio blakemorei TaxID=28181 RepID=A0A1E5Q9C9_9PROT|nr:SLAC1 anion channel family protein [Magnetovibrio blakemorei]OEJ68021.1 C4-dicarboxylate ABC transporter [Magnetovibrio blakemorei]